MAPMVRQYLNQSTWLPYIKIVYEEILLGTGSTILKNRDFFNNEDFLVAHADNLTIFDMQDFASQHAARPSGTDLTMMVFDTPDPQSCGIVSLDSQGVVEAFHEKVANPPASLANGAVYIFDPSVAEWISGLGKLQVDLSNELIPHFLGRIYTYRNAAYHRDIGTLASWSAANQDFPLMPALVQNSNAWTDILTSGNGQLLKKINAIGGF